MFHKWVSQLSLYSHYFRSYCSINRPQGSAQQAHWAGSLKPVMYVYFLWLRNPNTISNCLPIRGLDINNFLIDFFAPAQSNVYCRNYTTIMVLLRLWVVIYASHLYIFMPMLLNLCFPIPFNHLNPPTRSTISTVFISEDLLGDFANVDIGLPIFLIYNNHYILNHLCIKRSAHIHIHTYSWFSLRL